MNKVIKLVCCLVILFMCESFKSNTKKLDYPDYDNKFFLYRVVKNQNVGPLEIVSACDESRYTLFVKNDGSKKTLHCKISIDDFFQEISLKQFEFAEVLFNKEIHPDRESIDNIIICDEFSYSFKFTDIKYCK